jgi:phosphatidylglycerol lysyltransferase
MYAKRGRTWAALGDPVGSREEWPELVWRFVELADAHGGRAAFYQVPAASVPLYLDAGLKLLRLGEEAHVPLAAFSLKGSSRAGLRYALKRGERDGLNFEMIPPGGVDAVIDELEDISRVWLTGQAVGEKGFSVARFCFGAVGCDGATASPTHRVCNGDDHRRRARGDNRLDA